MEELKKKLAGQYRAGSRWLIYDTLKGSGWLGRVRCFASYNGAAAYCVSRSGHEGVLRIRVLPEVLAAMNGVRRVEPTVEERQQLGEVLARRPVTDYSAAIPVVVGLLRQKYFPVLWNRWLDPLRVVSTFQLLSRREMGDGKTKTRVRGNYGNFTMAITAFTAVARQAPPEGGEWLLTGAMGVNAELMDGEEWPEVHGSTTEGVLSQRGVLVFYRSGPAVRGGAEVRDIEPVHDPVQPVLVQTPYFASYDRKSGVMRFYDGMLKSLEPGKGRQAMDLGWFDFGCSAIFEDQLLVK